MYWNLPEVLKKVTTIRSQDNYRHALYYNREQIQVETLSLGPGVESSDS